MATSKKLQKILVIYTGGTFGMRPNLNKKGLELPQLKPTELKAWLNEQVPEMMKVAHCDVDILFQQDSCQFGAAHWFELASHILKKQARYNGVVILHGTDTLAYTASALSMLLSPARIPVVLTGAQKPLATLRNDARLNFISALEVAAHAPKPLRNRVMVVFHDEVFLGSRVRKKSAVDFAAFESPRFSKLASIGSEIHYHEIIHQLPPLKKQKPMLTRFCYSGDQSLPQILRTELTPQFCSTIFSQSVLQNLDSILLTLYASGTAPTHQPAFIDFLKRASESCTSILAITERENAAPSLKTYPAGRDLLEHQVIWCHDLTPEAAFVKAWCLREMNAQMSRKEYYAWVRKNWVTPLSDETSDD